MASPASVMALRNYRVGPSGVFECSPSVVTLRRIRVVSRLNCKDQLGVRHWCGSTSFLCRCTITSDLVEEKFNDSSQEPTIRNNSSNDGGGEETMVLKPPQKPVLSARPDRSAREEESEKKVMESLGEAFDMLENPPPQVAGNRVLQKRRNADNGAKPNVRTPTRSYVSGNSVKDVWRKGSPVQKVVGDASKGSQDKSSPGVEAKTSEVLSSPRPQQVPAKAQPSLNAKPSVAPPPQRKLERNKPIVVDKFAGKKAAGDPSTMPAASSSSASKPARRKQPILIDKFAKKLVDDPLGPPPLEKDGPTPNKRDWKVRGPGGGSRRRFGDKRSEYNSQSNGFPLRARRGRKSSKAIRRAARRAKEAAARPTPVKVEILEVGEEGMLVEDLAFDLAISPGDIDQFLFERGVEQMAHRLDKDMVKLICEKYEVEVIESDSSKYEGMAKKKEMLDVEDLDSLEDRPPVITIMGHVDHGKTTLLDHIRKSRVVASEAGGITQGIGAYTVQVPVDGNLETCVFLDTPGHEAFGAMRARGAKVTDIAIIVVAADDGVRPQTNEAIAHAKAANVPIVIAINKVDKIGANPDRVIQELSSIGLVPEDWGGNVPMIKISALKGENVDDLLETVMIVAGDQDLKANPHRNAKGTAIEAALDKSKGPVATLLVQNGTLKKGHMVVCGEAYGKVRALFDDRGGQTNEAGPSTPVQVVGLNHVPIAGDEFEVVESLSIARERADAIAEKLRISQITEKRDQIAVSLSAIASAVSVGKLMDGEALSLSSMASATSGGKLPGLDRHQLNIVLKVDVQGSTEAIRQAIQVLPQDNVSLKFLLQAPGDVNTSDIDLAIASKGIVIGFNVKAPGSVKSYAEKNGIEIRLYRVIYELINELRNAMEGLLEPVEENINVGSATVQAVFSSGSGRVAGCMVTEGKIVKDFGGRVVRNKKTIHTGSIDSLRRFKEEAKEVVADQECGIGFKDFIDWKVGDVIEVFRTEKKSRTLEEAAATVATALKNAGIDL